MYGLEKRGVRGDLISTYKYLKGRYQKDLDRLLSEVPRSNGYKLKHKKFHEEELLHIKGGRALEQLPKEVMESPSLETFKAHLGQFLCNML
ncbi:hypothetical protein BTVI_112334 [Pitangus sulphuratus]|nr:hypothetical protein BTVI_112334 [Pitangus sulphuratus]